MDEYLQHTKNILSANGGVYDNLSADGIPCVLDSIDPATDDNISIDMFYIADDKVMARTISGGTFDLNQLDDEDDFVTIDDLIADAFGNPALDNE